MLGKIFLMKIKFYFYLEYLGFCIFLELRSEVE